MLIDQFIYAQIVDLKNDNPYKKVFVDTDNFGVSYLKVLEESYKKVETDTIRFSMLNDLAYYWHTRNLVKALEFTKEGLNLTRLSKNELWEGRFQITQGAILLRMEKLDSAYTILENAKVKVKEEDKSFLNTQLGYVFERRGQLDRAADYALESLRLGEKFNDKSAMGRAYSDLSGLFWKNSKYEKGLEYGLRSLKYFEEVGMNDLDYDFTLYVVGNNYLELKKFGEALQLYEHAISIGERYGFYNNLSDIYISLVDLYTYLRQFEKAKDAGNNAIKYAELLDNNFMMMRSWLSIGKLQYVEGKYISSIESLQKSIFIATEDFGDEFYLSQAYETLGKAYAGNHNYKDAYQAFEKYDELKNKIFNAEADQRISLLQTEMDVAQKENTIQEQDDRIKKQRTRQTIVSVFAGLLLLMLLLLFITFQNNQKKSALLLRQNKEKEFLLKEIHHRVKNNLGIVSSLLDLQSNQLKDQNAIDAIQESQNRVYSMSMIHQKLYMGKNLAAIEMKDYFIQLSKHILDSYGAENQVSLEYNMDKLELDVDTAIPLGLIVNELLTNSFKYAFPDNRNGKIKIGLENKKDHLVLLKIEDNGIGRKENGMEKATGFGTQLINLLTQQLDGEIKRNEKDGTSVSIEFNFR
jgi:two-component sensor histidine kinase